MFLFISFQKLLILSNRKTSKDEILQYNKNFKILEFFKPNQIYK